MRIALAIGVMAACATSTVLHPYGSHNTSAGHGSGVHPGIDYAGEFGDPVLAAADGWVVGDPEINGHCAVLGHTKDGVQRAEYDYYTEYCNLSGGPAAGRAVHRGEPIGTVAGIPDISQFLHFQLCTAACGSWEENGELTGTIDPGKLMIGCFDRNRVYDKTTFVLTQPIACKR